MTIFPHDQKFIRCTARAPGLRKIFVQQNLYFIEVCVWTVLLLNSDPKVHVTRTLLVHFYVYVYTRAISHTHTRTHAHTHTLTEPSLSF